jgi:hypothetical protein
VRVQVPLRAPRFPSSTTPQGQASARKGNEKGGDDHNRDPETQPSEQVEPAASSAFLFRCVLRVEPMCSPSERAAQGVHHHLVASFRVGQATLHQGQAASAGSCHRATEKARMSGTSVANKNSNALNRASGCAGVWSKMNTNSRIPAMVK